MKKYLNNYAPSLGELWFIMLVLVCLGGTLISGSVAIIAQMLFNLDPETITAISLGAYPLIFSLAIPFIFIRAKEYDYMNKIDFLQTKPHFGKLPVVVLLLLLFLLVIAFSISIEPFTIWIPMPEWIKKIFESLSNHGWVSLISVVVMAPLFEEWLCRKVALGGLLKRGYSPVTAICWSALMFGVIHMNPWQTIPAFLMGMVFGWVYWRTRSIWSVIFMHAVNNGGAFLITFLFPDLPEDASMLDLVGKTVYPWILGSCILLTFFIIWVLHKYLAHPSHE